MSSEAAAITIVINGRLRPLITLCQQVFTQPANSPAQPMGLEPALAHVVVDLCQRWLTAEQLVVSPAELPAMLALMEFARRELAAEFHTCLQELQKTMTATVTARSAKEMQKFAAELPKQAEQATRKLREALKQRGALLDDCDAVIKKVRNQLAHAPNQ